MHFIDTNLKPIEVDRVIELQATFCDLNKYVNSGIVRDLVFMHNYIGTNLACSISIYYFRIYFKFIFFPDFLSYLSCRC